MFLQPGYASAGFFIDVRKDIYIFLYKLCPSMTSDIPFIGQDFGGQKFRRTKFSAPTGNFGSFVRRKKLSVFYFFFFADKTFQRTKFSEANQIFGGFVRRNFSDKVFYPMSIGYLQKSPLKCLGNQRNYLGFQKNGPGRKLLNTVIFHQVMRKN